MLGFEPTLMMITTNHITGSSAKCNTVQIVRACVPIVSPLLVQSESNSPSQKAQPSEERNMPSKKWLHKPI